MSPPRQAPGKKRTDRPFTPEELLANTPGMNETDLLIDSLFGPQSNLAGTISHYECREAQIRMARCVAQVGLDEGALLVEAATGTGKTLAYLLPLLALGKKMIVTTATKALQDQIVEKDIPLVRRILPIPFTFSSLKGRSNYLCRLRFRAASHGGGVSARDRVWLERIREWMPQTNSGDRDELQDLPEQLPLWFDISAGGDHCIGRKCEDFDACFLTMARNRAKKVDLVVVNHHLFFADLALKDEGFGEILPNHDVVVFDEAHRIPDVVTTFFGWEISNFKIHELVRDCRREFEETGVSEADLYDMLLLLDEAAHGLKLAFPAENCRDGLLPADMDGEPGRAIIAVEQALHTFREAMEGQRIRSSALAGLYRRAEDLLETSGKIRTLNDPTRIHWFEVRGRGVFLHASPLETGPTLQDALYPNVKAIIFTSATLATGSGERGFDFFRGQLGLVGDRVTVERLPPPFDHNRQTLLYVPRHMPEPNDPRYPQAVAAEIENLLRLSQGRALCLFTSIRMMDSVFNTLQGRLDYRLLIQGERPKGALLELFKRDVSSVLFGVASFWEGVDIPGEALSMVVVDRLPFASPSDPLVAARSRWLTSQKQNPFNTLSIPQAIIALKQGLGRLLRRSSDRGVMVVLDGRLINKWYGKRFLSGLPATPLTHDREVVRRFFLAKE